MTHWSQTLMPIWKATNLQLLPLMMLTHLKALWKQTELPIHIVCFYCSKRSWQKSNCYVLFLTSSFVRIFFEVLLSSLQLFNLHTELLPAKKREVNTHVLIPIYQLPSLQVQTYQTTLRRLDLKQVSWPNSTQIAPILKDTKLSGINTLSAGLIKNKRAGILYSTSKLMEGIQKSSRFPVTAIVWIRDIISCQTFYSTSIQM